MRVPIIDIGNSKGIRIPQAVLKQAFFGGELDLEVQDGKLVLRPFIDPATVPDFASLAGLDDAGIQRILTKLGERRETRFDIVVALIGADRKVKEAVYRNMSERVRAHVKAKVDKLEKGDLRDIEIERSRNLVSEIFMEMTRA